MYEHNLLWPKRTSRGQQKPTQRTPERVTAPDEDVLCVVTTCVTSDLADVFTRRVTALSESEQKAPYSQSTKHVWEGRTGFKNKSQWNRDEMPSSASLFCDQLALIHSLNVNTNRGCDCPTSSSVAAAWQTAGGSAVSRGFPQRCQPKVCFIYRCVYCSPSSAGWN